MAELRTLQSRIKTLNTRRVNILKGEQRRGKRKLTAVCSHQTRIGNLDAHLI